MFIEILHTFVQDFLLKMPRTKRGAFVFHTKSLFYILILLDSILRLHNNLIDYAVFFSFIGRHKIVAVHIFFNF